jgi:hypothetical protein
MALKSHKKVQEGPKVFTERTKNILVCAFRCTSFMPISVQQHFIAGGTELLRSAFDRRMKDIGFASLPPAEEPVNWDSNEYRCMFGSAKYILELNKRGMSIIERAMPMNKTSDQGKCLENITCIFEI